MDLTIIVDDIASPACAAVTSVHAKAFVSNDAHQDDRLTSCIVEHNEIDTRRVHSAHQVEHGSYRAPTSIRNELHREEIVVNNAIVVSEFFFAIQRSNCH